MRFKEAFTVLFGGKTSRETELKIELNDKHLTSVLAQGTFDIALRKKEEELEELGYKVIMDEEIFNATKKRIEGELSQLVESIDKIEKERVEYQSKIEFIVREDSSVGVRILWNGSSREVSDNLGILLNEINNGTHTPTCAQALLNIVDEEPEYEQFIHEAATLWKELIATEGMMKPSEVFHMKSRGFKEN